ncbi:polymeric immunoglobulin receptor-like [Myxocyprinus asiaticus]|uniref:polymeric immunoglobulin receptor-like n=1 Tax=Myxocyprinus asiaticus TaxID=70543 RepID=UPI0022218172|nr:polymeric immunoglobulin receptor-like [Myxocyprinus asiaticus]
MKIFIIFTFYLISGSVRCFDVTGYSGGSLLVDSRSRCSNNYQSLQKQSQGRWNILIDKYKQDQWINKGRFTLYCNKNGNLMIFIRELNTTDAGRYRIGPSSLDFIKMDLNVKVDSCCDGSKRLEMKNGRTAIFKCEYSESNVNNAKTVYKGNKSFDEVVYTTDKRKRKGRFSISDDRDKHFFSVTITAVTPDDGGVYLCGVQINRDSYSYSIITTTVHLHIMYLLGSNRTPSLFVQEEEPPKNTEVEMEVKEMPPVFGHEGESVEIICPYDPIYKSKSKYLCKGKCSTRDRNPLIETVTDQNETKTDRLTLNDDITASVFTVTITGLTAEDAGKYCCAMTLERDVNYLYTHLIIIRKQELILNQIEGDDISIKCKHHDEHQKFFCKGHQASMCVKDGVSLERIRDDGFSLSDEASTGVFTVNITDLRQEDSGIYWCGSDVITKVILNIRRDFSMIIIICVCVNLLLIGGFTLILCKLRHKRQEITSTSDKRKRDTNRTFPSNSSDGLLYAAVSFHKHEDSLTDDTVTFRKEEIHNDYATIRYCTRLK